MARPLHLLLLTPVVIWSTVFPLSKLVLEHIPPTSLAALRFSIGALCLLGYAVYAFGWPAVYGSFCRRYKTYVLLGVVGIFSNNLLQNLGLALTSASSASLLSTIDPLFTVVLSLLFLGEKLSKYKAAGLVLAFVGVYLVTTDGRGIADWGTGVGNLLIVAAAMGFSLYTVLSKQVLRHEEPPIVVAWSTVVGAVLLCAASFVLDRYINWGDLAVSHKLITLYLAVVPTSVSVVVYFYLLQRVQASQAATSLFLIPVFAIIWAVVLLGESVTPAMLVGGGLIISGVWLAIYEKRQLAPQHTEQR